MGQKVNPHGLRVGVIKDWDSKWYAEKDFADYLVEDHKIRKFLKNKLYRPLPTLLCKSRKKYQDRTFTEMDAEKTFFRRNPSNQQPC